jgi:hypothetical protein
MATDVKIITAGHFFGPVTSLFELYQRSEMNSLSRADELRQLLGCSAWGNVYLAWRTGRRS